MESFKGGPASTFALFASTHTHNGDHFRGNVTTEIGDGIPSYEHNNASLLHGCYL